MTSDDSTHSYERLRPWTDIEACKCARVHGLFLLDMLTDNPLHCDTCRREVDPERLQLSPEETNSVADWLSAATSLYRLWLDSGEYESYAKSCLTNPESQINRRGREIAQTLSQRKPTQLWFFHDTDDGEPVTCPVCSNPLDTEVQWGTGQCAPCHIHI